MLGREVSGVAIGVDSLEVRSLKVFFDCPDSGQFCNYAVNPSTNLLTEFQAKEEVRLQKSGGMKVVLLPLR